MSGPTKASALSEALGQWIGANLFAVIAIIAAGAQGWASITALQEKVERNQAAIMARLDAIEARQVNNADALSCTVRTLDRLQDRAGIAAPCKLAEAIR